MAALCNPLAGSGRWGHKWTGIATQSSLYILLCLSLCRRAASQEESVEAKIGMLFLLTGRSGNDIGPFWSRLAACGVLALNHINARNMELVAGVQLRDNFNVTYELHNTMGSPSVAVARTFDMMASGSNPSPVHAIVGPLMSVAAGPVSLMSAIEQIPVMGYASTSPLLDGGSLYPWFNRMIFSDSQLMYMIVKTCRELNWQSVSLLYQDDAWGAGIAEAVIEAAGQLNVTVATAQKFTYDDPVSVRDAVSAASKYRTRTYLFAVVLSDLDRLLFAAEDAGIAGPGHVWLNTAGVADLGETMASASDPERLQRLATGVLDVRINAVSKETADKFNTALRQTRAEDVYDPLMGDIESLRSFLPVPADEFCAYAYDSTWVVAQALSRVPWSEGKPVDGAQVLEEIRKVDFEGVTGHVVMNPGTGDRSTSSMNVVVMNWQAVEAPVKAEASSSALEAREVAVFGPDGKLRKTAEPVWAGGMPGWDAPVTGECDAGQHFVPDLLRCEPCPLGWHSPDGQECERCPAGTHASERGLRGCQLCPRNSFGNESGLAWCFPCPAHHEIALEFETGTSSAHCHCEARRMFGCRLGVTEAVLSVAIAVIVILAALVFFRRRHADAIWSIRANELHFCRPTEVLGSGSCGVVLAAEYRKTRVAVKRMLPAAAVESRGSGESRRELSGADAGTADLSRQPRKPHRLLKSSSEVSYLSSINSSTLNHLPGLQKEASLPFRGGCMDGLLPLRSEHQRLRRWFVEEMRVLSKVRHPCIVTIMGAVVENAEPMLVMELMEHGSLSDLMHNPTVALSGELVIPILQHVASGLTFLHNWSTPMVHADVRAANVLVDAQFRGKLTDFGVSSKRFRGTPFWMAPELLRGQPPSQQSDVYALGIMLWEVYARAEPYEGEDGAVVLTAVAREDEAGGEGKRPAVPCECPPAVAAIMRQCWHRDPLLRPPGEEALRMLRTLDVNTMGPEKAASVQGDEGVVFDEISVSSNVYSSARGGPITEDSVLRRVRASTGTQGCENGMASPVRAASTRRSKSVMEDMFPKHVAVKIMRGDDVPEDRRECATVLFSDIVGFTTLSTVLQSHEVSDMLHRLFTKLDALAEAHGVYKPETIGDCYIAVTNLVEAQDDDHGLRMARFALGLQAASRETLICEERPEMGYVQMRCGFDTGPLVGAIVGTRHKKYTILGNTVNTASRMESTGTPGAVHCTEAAANIIQNQLGKECGPAGLVLMERGKTWVKGKGHMLTFFVEDPDSPQSRSTASECIITVQPTHDLPSPTETSSRSVSMQRPRSMNAAALLCHASNGKMSERLVPP